MSESKNGSGLTKIAISQSNYIPWWGYFYLISKVDYFIFYDSAQYTKNDWRNRNLINSPNGPFWLSIPVGQNLHDRICDVQLPNGNWRKKHLSSVQNRYSQYQYFEEIFQLYRSAIFDEELRTLSQLNQCLITGIASQLLNLNTVFACSENSIEIRNPTERLISINRSLESQVYISAPAGKNYLQLEKFSTANLRLEYLEYPRNLLSKYGGTFQNIEYNFSIIDTYSRFGKDMLNLTGTNS